MNLEEQEKKTIVLRVDSNRLEPQTIAIAAASIRNGGLVVFPTETVYGLGADALCKKAVSRIFHVKGRPADNPLILHIADKDDVKNLARQIPKKGKLLMNRFWPGPLTLILKKKSIVPDITTGGLDTVALRMPSHPVANMLISMAETPIAAPSSNFSGFPSHTAPEHVMNDLFGKVEVIIYGRQAEIGVESTVLDVLHEPPILLRPGGRTVEEIESVIGKIDLHPAVKGETELDNLFAKSPGMKYRHYAPRAEVILVEGKDISHVRRRIDETYSNLVSRGKKVGLMLTEECSVKGDIERRMGSRGDFKKIAWNIFRMLRELDQEMVEFIIVEGVETRGLGLAIMNRLRRASGKNKIKI